jgi:hypothetical protein
VLATLHGEADRRRYRLVIGESVAGGAGYVMRCEVSARTRFAGRALTQKSLADALIIWYFRGSQQHNENVIS